MSHPEGPDTIVEGLISFRCTLLAMNMFNTLEAHLKPRSILRTAQNARGLMINTFVPLRVIGQSFATAGSGPTRCKSTNVLSGVSQEAHLAALIVAYLCILGKFSSLGGSKTILSTLESLKQSLLLYQTFARPDGRICITV